MSKVTANCINCARPMVVPPTALNKKYCGPRCRLDWHSKQRAQALALRKKLDGLLEPERVVAISQGTGVEEATVRRVLEAATGVAPYLSDSTG